MLSPAACAVFDSWHEALASEVLSNLSPWGPYTRDLAFEGLLAIDPARYGRPLTDLLRQRYPSDGAGMPFTWAVAAGAEATGDIALRAHFRAECERTDHSGGLLRHPCGANRPGREALLIDALQSYSYRLAWLSRETGDHAHAHKLREQWAGYRDALRDPINGLWSQGLGWLEDPAARSPGAWSRGHGWLLRGAVASSLLLEPGSGSDKALHRHADELLEALGPLQQPDGLWHALLHLPAEASPRELSGSALIASYTVLGVRHRVIGDAWSPLAIRALEGIARLLEDAGEPSAANIPNVSPGPGPLLTDEPYRVAAFAPGEPHGVGAVLFACAAARLLAR